MGSCVPEWSGINGTGRVKSRGFGDGALRWLVLLWVLGLGQGLGGRMRMEGGSRIEGRKFVACCK